MKGDPKVLELLNEALKEELTAINQYWLHYRMLDNWGVKQLADYERHESIDEMKHADRLAERILFLADMEAEQQGANLYRDLVQHAESVRDYVTRDLAREILADEEKHIDFIETQFEMIARMGLQNYIQLQSKPAEE
jgi:bacterioferritin